MTTTAASTANAPKPVENAHKPPQDRARGEADKTGSASDLFAALLALVSDTHAVATPDPAEPDNTAKDADGAALNPFAAMMAWVDPTSDAGVDTMARAGGRDRSGADIDAPATEGIDITGMTRVDEAAPTLPNAAAQARSAAASRPAFSPLNPNAPTPATNPSAHGTSPIGGGPAMVWQRGGTDALPQQQATPLAQVRSTVALNERFGAAGASLESPRVASPAPGEFTTTATTTSSSSATGPAATADTGTAGLVGAGSGNDAGGSGSEHAADSQTGDGQPQPHAEEGRNAEGPTVSHWGTQHLRHASLRVGDGGADAIDIQLQVKGQEVQVAFQTDNAEARSHLRENAGASLTDLMQRSGIQLGGVSVGSQGQAPSDTPRQPRSTGQRTEALGRTDVTPQASSPLAQPRTDGSRPLDVFA